MPSAVGSLREGRATRCTYRPARRHRPRRSRKARRPNHHRRPYRGQKTPLRAATDRGGRGHGSYSEFTGLLWGGTVGYKEQAAVAFENLACNTANSLDRGGGSAEPELLRNGTAGYKRHAALVLGIVAAVSAVT